MKGQPEILGEPLELQTARGWGNSTDLTALWEAWSQEGPAVFLESAGPLGAANQWSMVAGVPQAEFFGSDGKAWWKDPSGTHPALFDFWDFSDWVGGAPHPGSAFPAALSQSWFGILSYDFGKNFNSRHIHRQDRPRKYGTDEQERQKNLETFMPVPDFYFFKPSRLAVCNRQTREVFRFGENPGSAFQEKSKSRTPFKVRNLKALSNLAQYESRVRRVQDYIAQGDIYQANLAQTFQAQWEGEAGTLYRYLREMNPGPFMGLFRGEGFTVVSSSPERLAAGRGDWLETRPIAGTRPRGKDGPEDLRMRVELKTNIKEQAEHLMLVDLCRNDLGRVSRYGTVEVERYAEIESYARVHHLVSTVRSQRRPNAGFSEILRSLFPGGTITGCPKIRCMEIIDELEGRPRGFYTGSMGYLAPGPCFDFNILIRSFTLLSDGTLEFQAGAGIVADSDPRREYLETLYKVEALAQALGTTLLEAP